MVRFITVTSTQRGTFSRRDVAVLQKESSPFPLKRQPEKAEDEEDVKRRACFFSGNSQKIFPEPLRGSHAINGVPLVDGIVTLRHPVGERHLDPRHLRACAF